MTEIKSYTDISQSKKLAEILPIESADMFYATNSDWEGKIIGLLDVPLYIGSDGFVDTEMGEIYAWSLAALLSVLPEIDGISLKLEKVKAEDGYNGYYHHIEYEGKILIPYSKNPIDACVAMIEKLHELKML